MRPKIATRTYPRTSAFVYSQNSILKIFLFFLFRYDVFLDVRVLLPCGTGHGSSLPVLPTVVVAGMGTLCE